MKYRSYHQLFSKKFRDIYFLYFIVFFSIGSFDQITALFYAEIENGVLYYSLLLSLCEAADIFLPTAASMLSRKLGAATVSKYSFLLAIVSALLLRISGKSVIWILLLVIIYSTRSVFNFSLGTEIILSVPDEQKSRFFAIRDIFLYAAISAGLALAGLLAHFFQVKSIILILTSALFVPVLRGKGKCGKAKKGDDASQKDKEQKKAVTEQLKYILKNKSFSIILVIAILNGFYAATTAFYPFLAVTLGLNYQECLNSFAFTTLIGAGLALMLGSVADGKNKKFFYIFDLAFDAVPILLFYLANSKGMFLIALLLTTAKDAFSPVTFAYKYEVLGFENGHLAIAALESTANLFSLIMPVVAGILWNTIGKTVFLLSFGIVILSAGIAFFLPNSKVEKQS